MRMSILTRGVHVQEYKWMGRVDWNGDISTVLIYNQENLLEGNDDMAFG